MSFAAPFHFSQLLHKVNLPIWNMTHSFTHKLLGLHLIWDWGDGEGGVKERLPDKGWGRRGYGLQTVCLWRFKKVNELVFAWHQRIVWRVGGECSNSIKSSPPSSSTQALRMKNSAFIEETHIYKDHFTSVKKASLHCLQYYLLYRFSSRCSITFRISEHEHVDIEQCQYPESGFVPIVI